MATTSRYPVIHPMRPIDLIVIHHSASPRSTTIDQIREWHIKKGWQDIGYHIVISGGGRVLNGRPINIIGAHAAGYNMRSIGVCVIGNNTVESERWTPDQVKALADVVKTLQLVYPDAKVLGHRDLEDTHTLCPGVNVKEVLDTYWSSNNG